MINFFKQMLSGYSGQISSKRVCGFSGWIIILIVYIYCAFHVIQAPTITDALLMAVVTLLGVDSVTDIFKNKSSSQEETKEIEE